jgi:hypothetical protein
LLKESKQTSALFICARNEIEGSRVLADRVPYDRFDEIYELDGNSTDGTREFWAERAVKTINGVKKGEIFTTAASTTQADNIVFFAPDGNENPDDIANILDYLEQGYDMAIASRFMKGARNEEDDQFLPLRAWANRAFTLIVRLIWGGKLTDTINGFRGLKLEKLVQLNLECSGFDIEFQTSIRFLKRGWMIVEFPTCEGDRIGGNSSSSSIHTGLLMLRRVWRELRLGRDGI